MPNIKLIQAVANLMTGARDRISEEHADFLNFYEQLVRSISSDAVEAFGKMEIEVKDKGKEETWGILLTAADFMFWKNAIEKRNVRFADTTDVVKSGMLNRMTRMAETERLTVEERNKLLDLLSDQAND